MTLEKENVMSDATELFEREEKNYTLEELIELLTKGIYGDD